MKTSGKSARDLLSLYLVHLEAYDVSLIGDDLFKDELFSVAPTKSPTWTVAVLTPRSIVLCQDVVSHYREHICKQQDANMSIGQIWTGLCKSLTLKKTQKIQIVKFKIVLTSYSKTDIIH